VTFESSHKLKKYSNTSNQELYFSINWYSGLFLLLQIWNGYSSGFDNKGMKIVQFSVIYSILDGALQISHELVMKSM